MKNQTVFYAILALLAIFAAWMVKPFFAPILLAVVAGYFLLPLYDFLGRGIASPPLRAVLILMLMLFAVALPVVLGLSRVTHQIHSVLSEDRLIGGVATFNDSLDRVVKRHVPITENVAAYTEKVREAAMHSAPEIIGHVGETALDLVIFLYVLFFVLTDGREFLADIVFLIPLESAMKTHLVGNIEATMTGVLYGQVMTALAQAALAAIGYTFAGLHHVLLWTLLTLIAATHRLYGRAGFGVRSRAASAIDRRARAAASASGAIWRAWRTALVRHHRLFAGADPAGTLCGDAAFLSRDADRGGSLAASRT
jgi:predicted PurR-regulated permease PerM